MRLLFGMEAKKPSVSFARCRDFYDEFTHNFIHNRVDQLICRNMAKKAKYRNSSLLGDGIVQNT